MNSLKELPYLCRPPRDICFWGGGGGSGASAIESAGRQEQQAGLQAAQLQEKYLQNAMGQLQPYQQLGTASAGALGSLWGLPGYGRTDPSKQLEATPGYQFLLRQAIGGTDYTGGLGRYGASTGQALSGNALKAASDRAQQMGLSYALQPYIQSLQFGTGQGLSAVGTGAGLTMGAATQMGQDYMAAAQANAQAQIQAENARAAEQQGSFWNQIPGMLGLGAGMFLGMPGVGSSIGGAIGNAIGGWGFGGPPTLPKAQYGGRIGGPTVVGEGGPEVFVPDRPGFIIPNHLLNYSTFSILARSFQRSS